MCQILNMRGNIIIAIMVFVASLVGCNNQSHDNLKIYKGKVVTEAGVPIPDVTVSVGETYITTDNNGCYSFHIPVHNQQYNAAFKHTKYTDHFATLSNDSAIIVLSEKRECDSSNCAKVSIVSSAKCSYNLKSEVVSSEANLFDGISPEGSIINLPHNQLAKGFYCGFAKLTAEKKDDHSQLKHFDNHIVELSFRIPENQKDNAPYAVHFWRYDENLNSWVMGPLATKQGNYYTAIVSETGWWCAYETPSELPVRCIKAQLNDFNNDPIPYAELTITDEKGKDIGHYTSTKDGKVLFYFTNNLHPKVFCKGYHLSKPNENEYPFVPEDTLYTINKLIIDDKLVIGQEIYKITINEVNVTEAKEDNNISTEEDIDPVKYSFTYKSKPANRYHRTTPFLLIDTSAIPVTAENRVVTITPEMLGLNLIKEYYGGKAEYSDNAHVYVYRDSSVTGFRTLTIQSHDYEKLIVRISAEGSLPKLLAIDSTQYEDDKGNKKCRINSFSFSQPEGTDGLEFISIIYDGNRDKNYNLGKHSFGVRDTARFSIKYHSSFDYTRKVPLGSAKYKIVASKPIELIATVYNEECQLRICRVTDAYGRNALSNARYDYIKPEALLTGKLNVEFIERDSIYNRSVCFNKYTKDDFCSETDYARLITIIGGVIILLIIIVQLKDIPKKRRTKEGQYSLIAHILLLNPVFSKKQVELIEKYIKDNGLSKKAINDVIKKKVDNKEKAQYQHFTYVENLDLTKRRNLIHLLFQLSAEDDGIKNDEWDTLSYIMSRLGLNNKNIEYMQRRYSPLRSEYDDYSKYYQSTNRQQSSSYSSNASVAYSANASDYAELGLSYGATKEEVQQAYHKLALELHPDLPKNADRHDECVRRMAAINVAYKRLIRYF